MTDQPDGSMEALVHALRDCAAMTTTLGIAVGILARLRSGAIPLPEDAPQIAALRAELGNAESRITEQTPAPVTAIAGTPTQDGIAPVTRVMHPAWPAVAPGEAYAYFTDGTVCFHLGNFRLHRDAVAAASAHPDGSVGINGPGHTPSTRHWALREVKPGPGSVAERTAATHEIPNGYYPDGRSRPNVPVQVLWGPAPGSANRLATIRRLDTGEVGPCPTYAITARTPPTSIRGGLERAGVSPANIDKTIAALPQIVAGELKPAGGSSLPPARRIATMGGDLASAQGDKADRDRLAAQVEGLTRERDHLARCVNARSAERDRALADLAAERAAREKAELRSETLRGIIYRVLSVFDEDKPAKECRDYLREEMKIFEGVGRTRAQIEADEARFKEPRS